MATHQLVRQKQQTGTWSTMFPAEQNTLQESEVFVKKLLAVGLSTITYVRTIFPESSYHEQDLDGMKLKVLRDNTSCRTSNTLISWMRSCFEAIEKKYLRRLTFAILNKDNLQEAHETYTYRFFYTDAGTVMSGPGTPNSSVTSNNTRQATEKMLRFILSVTYNMKPLPKSICLSINLGYYDDVTPPDYEPSGFSPAESKHYTFRSSPVKAKVGSAATKFHAINLFMCVGKDAYPSSQDEEQVEEEQQQELVKDIGSDEESSTVVRSFSKYGVPQRSTYSGSAVSVPGVSLNNSLKDDHQVPTQSHTSSPDNSPQNGGTFSTQKEEEERPQSSNTDSEGFPVRCPCGVSGDQGLMILCDVCQKWQHGACFNVLEESEVKASHVCEECANPDHPCTDPTLPQQPELVSFCLFRRALVLLKQMKASVTKLSLAQQLGVDITISSHLFQQLKKQKILYVKKKLNRVNRTKLLCEAFPKYLKGHGNPRMSQEIVDLTLQTSISSQSLGDFDLDVTPDLDVASLQESDRILKNQERKESLSNTLDETLDVMSFTQDVTVGTQAVQLSSEPCLEPSQTDTYSEALATAGNTLLLLDSSQEPSQKTKNRYSASMPLHSGMDVEDGSLELGKEESSETFHVQRRKLSLGKPSQWGRCGKRAFRRAKKLRDFEVTLSQDSDLQSKNSISQDSEILGKKRKTC